MNQHSKLKRIIGLFLKFVIPMVISLGLCWVLFRDDNIEDFIQVVRNKCDFRWIGAMLVVSFLSFAFRALRWRLQLKAVGIKPSYYDVLLSIFGTYAVNLVFPRLGEVWRSGYIAHRQNASFGTVMGTMLADRFADMLTVLLFVVATLFLGHDALTAFLHRYPETYLKLEKLLLSPWIWIALVTIIVALRIFLKSHTSNRFVQKIQAFCQGLWSGFAALLKIEQKGCWLLWTVMLWGCYFLQMVLAFKAFPFTSHILAHDGLTAVLVCFTLGSIAMGIPSNGGIGPYQIAVIFGLSLYAPGVEGGNVSSNVFELDSKAFANLVLTMSTCLTIVVGLWAFISIALRGKKKAKLNVEF